MILEIHNIINFNVSTLSTLNITFLAVEIIAVAIAVNLQLFNNSVNVWEGNNNHDY